MAMKRPLSQRGGMDIAAILIFLVFIAAIAFVLWIPIKDEVDSIVQGAINCVERGGTPVYSDGDFAACAEVKGR